MLCWGFVCNMGVGIAENKMSRIIIEALCCALNKNETRNLKSMSCITVVYCIIFSYGITLTN